MKTNITLLSLVILMAGCAVQPLPTNGADGQQGYAISCISGIEQCYQKAAKLCSGGYDIIEHTHSSSILVPHYGQYPMTVNTDNLTIRCR